MISRSLLISTVVLSVSALSATAFAGQVDAASPGPSGPSSLPSTQPSRVDQAESVVRRYSLVDILPALGGEDWTQQLFVIPGMRPDWFDGGGEGALDLQPEIDLDSVADLLSQALGDDLRFEGRGLSVSERGELLLLAPPDVQDKAAKILDGLRDALSAHAVLTVDVLDLEGGNLPFPDQANLSEEDASRLVALALERGAEHVQHELNVTPGNTAISDTTRQVPIIADFDVEIAQMAGIWDPIRTVIDIGQHLVVRGAPVGDSVEISVILRVARLVEDVRQRPFLASLLVANETSGVRYGQGPELLEQAEVAQHAYAFSGSVGAGKALVCASELNIGGVRRTQLVVIRALEVKGQRVHVTPLSPDGRALVVVSKEAFSPSYVDSWYNADELDEGIRHSVLLLFGAIHSEVPSVLDEMLSFQFNLLRDYGPWALIITDPAWDRAGAAELQSLAEGWPVQSEASSLTFDLSTSGVGEAIPARALLPARAGQESAILVGTSRNVIWDYDVEVAQSAALPDPVIGYRFSGIGAILKTGGGATPSLDVSLLARVPAEAPATLEIGAQEFRFFDRQHHDTLRVRERKSLGEDGSVSFGTRATGTKLQALELRAKVR